MKHKTLTCLLTATALLAGGCAYNQAEELQAQQEQQAQLADIEARITALDASVQESQAGLFALEASQLNSTQVLDDDLALISAELEALPATVAELCRPPESEQRPEQTCEPGEPLRTVIVQSDKLLLGELETVWIEPPGIPLVARMDTGATSSSLHAENLREFERDGEDWVRFSLIVSEQSIDVEQRIVRHARVIQQADPSGSRRPVVQMRIRIGNVYETFDFTLADRSHLQNEMILGRNFLTDTALVDVGRQFIQPVYKPDTE